MNDVLAAACQTDETACDWLVDQGVPRFIADLLGGVIAPATQALVIILVTFVVATVLRRLVARLATRMTASTGANRLGELGLGHLGVRAGVDPRRNQRIDSITQVSRSIVAVIVWTIGILMALGAFGLNLGPLIASAGIVGVALGFGAQSLVKDFLSGMFMLAEDQFGIGDIVDVGEAEGVVESISLRTTALRGVDGTLWFVPNGEIRRVGNKSQDWARALLDISVAYDADVDRAVEVIAAASAAFAVEQDYADKVLEDPEILGIQDLGADAVVIRLWIKTVPGEQYGLSRALRRRIKLALDDAEIAIPFPQRTVWLRHQGDAQDVADLQPATDGPTTDDPATSDAISPDDVDAGSEDDPDPDPDSDADD